MASDKERVTTRGLTEHAQKLVKIGPVVPEICSRQTDRQTQTDTVITILREVMIDSAELANVEPRLIQMWNKPYLAYSGHQVYPALTCSVAYPCTHVQLDEVLILLVGRSQEARPVHSIQAYGEQRFRLRRRGASWLLLLTWIRAYNYWCWWISLISEPAIQIRISGPQCFVVGNVRWISAVADGPARRHRAVEAVDQYDKLAVDRRRYCQLKESPQHINWPELTCNKSSRYMTTRSLVTRVSVTTWLTAEKLGR